MVSFAWPLCGKKGIWAVYHGEYSRGKIHKRRRMQLFSNIPSRQCNSDKRWGIQYPDSGIQIIKYAVFYGIKPKYPKSEKFVWVSPKINRKILANRITVRNTKISNLKLLQFCFNTRKPRCYWVFSTEKVVFRKKWRNSKRKSINKIFRRGV